jgi:hypothetical protein
LDDFGKLISEIFLGTTLGISFGVMESRFREEFWGVAL